MTSWRPAYIGIGSNLDDPRQQVSAALARLAGLPDTRLELVSPLYGSRPLGPISQPDFVNAAAALLTRLELEPLFLALRDLERALGRVPPRERWGPRRIDLDLLAFGQELRSTAELVVPHPGLAARNFVLVPLADIAPDFEVPGLGAVRDLAARLSMEGLWRLSD